MPDLATLPDLPRVEWVPGQQPLPGLDTADLVREDTAAAGLGALVVTLQPLDRYL